MNHFKIFLLTICMTGTFINGQKAQPNLKGLDQEINNIIADYKGVGLSVAIVKDDKVIYSQGFGFRDLEKKLPVTVNTVFPIGSITKSFTSILIGSLQDENKLSVDSKPALYIPNLQFYNDRMNAMMTVGDLLSHKSGIGRADGSYILFPENKRIDLMKRLPYLKPGGEVKDSWIYSNLGYIILGTIAEQVSGETWENLIKNRVFKPLQMDHSSTTIEEMVKSDDYSLPYGVYKGSTEKILYQRPHNDQPGAAVNSTANDMANWMRMWLNNGTFQQQKILSENYVKEAMSIKAIFNGRPPATAEQNSYLFGYGYGWNVNMYRGHYKVHHGGAVSGFSSNAVLFPVEKIGIIVLSNQQNSDLPYTLTSMISNRMLGLDGQKPYAYTKEIYDIKKPEKTIKPIDQNKKPMFNLSDYTGKFTNLGYGTFEIVKEGDQLFVVFPAFKFRLEPMQYNAFVCKLINEIPQQMNPEFELNFTIDNEGKISDVVMDLQKEGVHFKKVDQK
ncbi:serine hydrolase [Chryseobacterium sp. ISL-6]|uniref:serine hydrolase n=1 Tax=Chryseobacterium sp. ISL-6 TaxID=2819143 RepID=UPI001BE7E92B|nr:serine hydrolase [Chryseobacterium sp. ISL-6]MBT2622536.1 serine hydrolase [Chryseobacterium sp. ISL-6]